MTTHAPPGADVSASTGPEAAAGPTWRRSPWAGAATREELATWTAVADEVAAQLALGADERDASGAPPVEAAEMLRDSGLLPLLVPLEAGGHGAHWETAFHVVRTVARADASLGLVLGYHYLNQACVTFYGSDEARQLRWYRRSVEGRWLWSDSFNPVSPDLSLLADPDGEGAYRLSGTKRFATGAAVADVIIAGAVASGGQHDGQLVVFVVPADRTGVEHLGDWDNLGYRASASGSVRYSDVRVDADDVLGVDTGEPFSSVVTPGVQLLFGNAYLAAAQGALARARELVLARAGSWFLSGVDRYADDPLVHRAVGDLVARTAAVEALADALNHRFDEAVGLGAVTTEADRAAIEVAVAALKVVSTDVGLDATAKVYEVTGASSTRRSTHLDRFWRDVRTHSLHDPVDYKRVEVGAHYLTGAVQPVSLYT